MDVGALRRGTARVVGSIWDSTELNSRSTPLCLYCSLPVQLFIFWVLYFVCLCHTGDLATSNSYGSPDSIFQKVVVPLNLAHCAAVPEKQRHSSNDTPSREQEATASKTTKAPEETRGTVARTPPVSAAAAAQQGSVQYGRGHIGHHHCRRETLIPKGLPIRCYNILFISVPLSPIQTTITLAATMRDRGHTVRVLSTDDARHKVQKVGLEFVSAGYVNTAELVRELFDSIIFKPVWEVMPKAFAMIDTLLESLRSGLTSYLTSNGQNEHTSSLRPDVVVVAAVADLSQLRSLNIPYVILFPSVAMSPLVQGMPYVPPLHLTTPLHHQSFVQRLQSLFVSFLSTVLISSVISASRLPIIDPDLTKGLHLVCSAPGFDYPAHMPPLKKLVGPVVNELRMDISKIEPDVLQWIETKLPSSLQQTDPGLPIVYVSLGTIVNLNEELASIFTSALDPFSRKPKAPRWRILWALPEAQWQYLPERFHPDRIGVDSDMRDYFRILTWATTPAVLSHSLVKVFVTHCGANGVHESLVAGTPVIGLPFVGDQPAVCERVRKAHVGEVLPRYFPSDEMLELHAPNATMAVRVYRSLARYMIGEVVTVPAFQQAIDNVLFSHRGKFEESVKKVQACLQIPGGAETAADWVELVASMQGDMEMLQTAVDSDGVITAFSIDIAVVAAFILVPLIMAITWYLFKFVGRIVVKSVQLIVWSWSCWTSDSTFGVPISPSAPSSTSVSMDVDAESSPSRSRMAESIMPTVLGSGSSVGAVSRTRGRQPAAPLVEVEGAGAGPLAAPKESSKKLAKSRSRSKSRRK
eukprot:GHVQ01002723.1.p1 GENE.GHVQ01002723.1~~GHVQ01002723.1.p1  ORF type:complete len:809 (+),score=52.81 GHVQ01002723.1:379-2805(+)